MRLMNMIDRPIVLHRNTKMCLVLEEIDLTKMRTEYQQTGVPQYIVQTNEFNKESRPKTDYRVKLKELGLTEIDILSDSCEVSGCCKRESWLTS